jgi:hypothetical protein
MANAGVKLQPHASFFEEDEDAECAEAIPSKKTGNPRLGVSLPNASPPSANQRGGGKKRKQATPTTPNVSQQDDVDSDAFQSQHSAKKRGKGKTK